MLRQAIAELVGLDATPAGNVVLACGELQHAAVEQLVGFLHKALAIGALPHDDSAVVVLQSTGRDFAGRSCAVVSQHHDGHVGGHRHTGGAECLVARTYLAAGAHYLRPLGHEEADKFDGLHHQSARIAAQVEHQALHALCTQLRQCPLYLGGRVLGELAHGNQRHAIVNHFCKSHRRQRDGAARQREVERRTFAEALHTQTQRSAGLAAQSTAHRVAVSRPLTPAAPWHLLSVNGYNHIAPAQSCLGRRHAGIRLGDDTAVVSGVINNERADAGVLSRGHLPQILGSVGGIVVRVGVQALEQIVDSVLYDVLGIERVDVVEVQLLVEVVEDAQLFGRLGIVSAVLRRGGQQGHCQQDAGQ